MTRGGLGEHAAGRISAVVGPSQRRHRPATRPCDDVCPASQVPSIRSHLGFPLSEDDSEVTADFFVFRRYEDRFAGSSGMGGAGIP